MILYSFEDYYDIFTRQNITKGDFEVNIYESESVEDYLITFNMVKEEYTEEDLKEMLNKFINIQEKDNDKQLVKE